MQIGTMLLTALGTAVGPENPRYLTLRAEWKDNLPLRVLRFFQVQAVVDVALRVPSLLMARGAAPFGLFTESAGLAPWGVALAGESISDAWLSRFKRDPANRGRVCRRGLWSVPRHPNDFFEWLLWCSFVLMATGAPLGWVSGSAPVFVPSFPATR